MDNEEIKQYNGNFGNRLEALSHDQEIIVDYLKNGMKHGKRYFKSKYIAKELGMTPRIVGVNLTRLSNDYREIKIEKWSYSKSTTWRVEATI